MAESEPTLHTVEQIYRIVAGHDPAVEKDLRKIERVLRHSGDDPNTADSSELSFSPPLQYVDPVVIFEELGDLTPIDAMRRALNHEKKETTISPTESTESKTPIADRYLSEWYKQKLEQEAQEKRQRMSRTGRKTITKQQKQKRTETVKKRVPKERPLPPANFITVQDLEEQTGVGKYTLRIILRSAPEKVKVGKFVYFNKEQAEQLIELHEKAIAERKENNRGRKSVVPPEGRTNAVILSEQFPFSKYQIIRHLKNIRVPINTWFPYPEDEAIRILTQLSEKEEENKRDKAYE